MGTCFDITNPNVSYNWLHEVLHLQKGELLDKYCIDCHNEFEEFYEMFLSEIKTLDIENMDIMAFQVTSNGNECSEIKKYGLHNLQWVFGNETEIRLFLELRGISFDIEKRFMYIGDNKYDVDYEKYRGLNCISDEKKRVKEVGRKLYNDYQINAFLFCKDINKYGTIHKAPEILFTLSSFNKETTGIDEQWAEQCKTYVVKFKTKFKYLASCTFYNSEEEYLFDSQNNWMKLRKTIFSYAVRSAFSESESQVFVYIKPEVVISLDNILECIPAEEWRKDVLKYFE